MTNTQRLHKAKMHSRIAKLLLLFLFVYGFLIISKNIQHVSVNSDLVFSDTLHSVSSSADAFTSWLGVHQLWQLTPVISTTIYDVFAVLVIVLMLMYICFKFIADRKSMHKRIHSLIVEQLKKKEALGMEHLGTAEGIQSLFQSVKLDVADAPCAEPVWYSTQQGKKVIFISMGILALALVVLGS